MVELGESTRRLEDESLVLGAGSYVADLVDGDTLHCAFARSDVAHGTFRPPSLEDALQMPGVVAVHSADTLKLPLLPSSPGPSAPDASGMNQPPLALGRVRHVGEPVVVVVAETARQAEDALDAIWIDIQPLPVVVDINSALEGEVLLFPESGSNLVHEDTVRSAGARPAVDIEISVEVEIPRLSPLTIEPLAILVRPDGDRIDVWCGHQAPGRLPKQLSMMLGIPKEMVRVRVPDVGGAFGTKSHFYPEYSVVAALARVLNRPIAWLQRRREQMASGTHGRSQTLQVSLGGSYDGRIRVVETEILGDVGAYPSAGSRVPLFTQHLAQGAYDIEYLEARTKVVVTNTAPTGPYRGAGRPEAAIGIERAVDAFALRIGMSPEEVRRRNLIKSSQFPFTTQTGATYDSGDYLGALDLAVEVAQIDDLRREQKERLDKDDDLLMGVGIALFVERSGGSVSTGEWGRVELLPDGSISVMTGSTSAGQSHRTVWSQIAASVFSVSPSRVDFNSGDTGQISQSLGSFASRSLQLGGSAVLRTAIEVRERAFGVAADMLEAARADLELVEGEIRVVGSPDSGVPLETVAAEAVSKGIVLSAEELFNPGTQTFPYGAYVAVVEIERETGVVKLTRLVTVDDCGRVVNPMVVEGQLHGSLLQGIGESLLEAISYDEQGQLTTGTLMSYLVPTAAQELPLISRRIETPAPSNPLGAKGIGESGCIGAPAAILNAVHDALRACGVEAISFPLTPQRVWVAIQRAQTKKQDGRDLEPSGSFFSGRWLGA